MYPLLIARIAELDATVEGLRKDNTLKVVGASRIE
jgi:hypothetical protein